MKHLIRVLIAFCLFGFGISLQAQNSIPAAGGIALGAGNSTVSYTVGQVFYTTISGAGTISQGVQQTSISILSGTEESKGITLELSVYPNPAAGFVMLKIESYEVENLSYKLFDLNGNLLQDRKVEGNMTLIQLGNMLPGTFILKINENNKEVRTFKIIKK
jgi:hypothetical protein